MEREKVEELLGRRVEDDERIIDSLIELKSEAQKKEVAGTAQSKTQRVALRTGNQKERLQLNLRNKQNMVSLTTEKDKLTLVDNGKKLLEFDGAKQAAYYQLYIKDLKVHAGNMKVNKFDQWQTFNRDNFAELQDKMNWNQGKMATVECGGVTMLGGPGHTSTAKLQRKFEKLPPHKEIRIKFFFHYIDAWSGEVAYLKTKTSSYNKKNELVVTENIRWTEPYDYTASKKGANICGNESVDQNKFLYFADVQFPHKTSTLEVQVGSTLTTDPGYSSYGISSFSLYYI